MVDATITAAVFTRGLLTASYTVLGYLLQRFGVISRDDGKVMLRFVVNVTLPALLLHTLTHSGPLLGPGTPLVWLVSIFATAFVASLGFLVYRRRPSYERGLLVGSLCGVNLGTFAYPFVEAVWGADGLRLAALYDIPNALIVFGVSAAVFAAEQRETQRRARAQTGKHDDGGVYHGEWSVGGESKQGVGVYTYPSGAVYEGEWNNNVQAGYGVYLFAKGGSYAGQFRRGSFNGMGLRFLRNGGVKSGRFEEGDFVEALGMDASDEAASKAADASNAARKAAETSQIQETNAQAAARIVSKILTFPPMVALILAGVATAGGAASTVPGTSPLPDAITALIAPLAAANRPLVLVTLGALFEPALPRMQMRSAVHFLATKYALSLLAAAVAAAFVPASLGAVRFALAALVLAPVPSVCVQYALDHDMDARLAGCLTNYSQALSLAAVCALGLASSVTDGGATIAGWATPAGLAAAAAVTAAVGFLADRGLAPVKMTFKPTRKPAPAQKLAISKPDDGDGDAGGKGTVTASAALPSRTRDRRRALGDGTGGGADWRAVRGGVVAASVSSPRVAKTNLSVRGGRVGATVKRAAVAKLRTVDRPIVFRALVRV